MPACNQINSLGNIIFTEINIKLHNIDQNVTYLLPCWCSKISISNVLKTKTNKSLNENKQN